MAQVSESIFYCKLEPHTDSGQILEAGSVGRLNSHHAYLPQSCYFDTFEAVA